MNQKIFLMFALALTAVYPGRAVAQDRNTAVAQPTGQNPPGGASDSVPTPPDYVIGLEDALSVLFWRDQTMSADVVVRPDGKISLPLLNDVQAAGLTPEQLRGRLLELAKKYVEDPSVTVAVRQVNSRKVFITGEVTRPGAYSLTTTTTVLQLIAIAGGLTPYADGNQIKVLRTVQGRQTSIAFNYDAVRKGKRLAQNIELKVGDTIVVP